MPGCRVPGARCTSPNTLNGIVSLITFIEFLGSIDLFCFIELKSLIELAGGLIDLIELIGQTDLIEIIS